MKNNYITIIIPVYNEGHHLVQCLESLQEQTVKTEIIVVDDGSTDKSKIKEQNAIVRFKIKNLFYLQQKHLGPAAARNLGAKRARGKILVFVDADMTFTPDFVETLIRPIIAGETKGTFTKEEYVSNWDNMWARCWNYNLGLYEARRLAKNYPDTAPVFRAILKSEFMKVDGFTSGVGWTDDWTLSRKLGYQSTATMAKCFHANPENVSEIWRQASWIGKNEFYTRNIFRLKLNLWLHSLPVSVVMGIFKSVQTKTAQFLIFKIIYDLALSTSLFTSLWSRDRNK